MQNITTRHERPDFVIVERDGKTIGYVNRDALTCSLNPTMWEARPFHDALTVGNTYPRFTTLREAVDWLATYN